MVRVFFLGSTVFAADLTKRPTLYLVGYAHLDTQWRWEYPRTIKEFLPNTLHDNVVLFEKYPHYVFNFSGANRYRMMKEYYPADYEKLKAAVRGRRAKNVRLTFAAPVVSAREINDQEMPLRRAVSRGSVGRRPTLQTSLGPYQLRTFAVKLAPPPVHAARPHSMSIAQASATWSPFDSAGRMPATEMLPATIGVRINDAGGTLVRYRYLLFDFFDTEGDDNWGNTFYSEVDVLERK